MRERNSCHETYKNPTKSHLIRKIKPKFPKNGTAALGRFKICSLLMSKLNYNILLINMLNQIRLNYIKFEKFDNLAMKEVFFYYYFS